MPPKATCLVLKSRVHHPGLPGHFSFFLPQLQCQSLSLFLLSCICPHFLFSGATGQVGMRTVSVVPEGAWFICSLEEKLWWFWAKLPACGMRCLSQNPAVLAFARTISLSTLMPARHRLSRGTRTQSPLSCSLPDDQSSMTLSTVFPPDWRETHYQVKVSDATMSPWGYVIEQVV